MPEAVSVCLSKWCKLDPRTVPVKAEAAANYLNGMMSRLEARERGFDTAIMLDTAGNMAEGATESVFFVKEGRLFTPGPEGILDSITRKTVLDLAPALGIETRQADLSPEILQTAEEVFLSRNAGQSPPGPHPGKAQDRTRSRPHKPQAGPSPVRHLRRRIRSLPGVAGTAGIKMGL